MIETTALAVENLATRLDSLGEGIRERPHDVAEVGLLIAEVLRTSALVNLTHLANSIAASERMERARVEDRDAILGAMPGPVPAGGEPAVPRGEDVGEADAQVISWIAEWIDGSDAWSLQARDFVAAKRAGIG